MKKTRFIALVLAVSLMIMGSGYAYWTDALVISNTVDTGKFDVNFVKLQQHPRAESGKYMDAKVTIDPQDSKKITFKVTDMYPGGYARYDIAVKNNGTLPAKLNGADVVISENEAIAEKLEVQFNNGKAASKAKDLAKNVMDYAGGTVIEPGQIKYFYCVFRMPTSVNNADNLEDSSVTIDLTLNWKQ